MPITPLCTTANVAPASVNDVDTTIESSEIAANLESGANVSTRHGLHGDDTVIKSRSAYDDSNSASVLSQADRDDLVCCWTNELKRDAQEDYAFTLPKFAERMETVRGKYSNVFREDIYEFVLAPKLRDISSTLRVLGLKTIGSFINAGYPSGPEIVNRVWFDIRDVFSEAQKQEVTDLLNAWKPGFIEDGTDPWR